MKKLIVLAVLSLVLTSCSEILSALVDLGPAKIQIVNKSTSEIDGVFLSPNGVSYGSNRLSANETIPPGTTKSWEVNEGVYDVYVTAVTAPDGTYPYWRFVSLAIEAGKTKYLDCND